MGSTPGSKKEFGQQSKEHRPQGSGGHGQTADSQPPLVLTLEQKTPVTRWIIVSVLGLVGFMLLTYWINADNPKITASVLAAMKPEVAPTPTLVANEAGYSATVEFWPLDPVPAGSTMMFTTTLYLNGKPAPGVKSRMSLYDRYGFTLRDLKPTTTGPDGTVLTTYDMGIFKKYEMTASVSFFEGDTLLIRTKANFTLK